MARAESSVYEHLLDAGINHRRSPAERAVEPFAFLIEVLCRPQPQIITA